jgi:two-component system, NtrC family, sensor kinase
MDSREAAGVIPSEGFAPRFKSAILIVVMFVVVLGGAGLLIWLDRVSTLREAHLTALRLAQVLGEQTQRTVQAVNLMLTSLGDELQANPDLPDHDRGFESKMRGLLQASPFLRALFVIGPDGFITQDTDYPLTPRVSLADRGYFIAHAENGDLGLYIGPPLQSRSVDVWFLSMSRRVPSADGSFAGIVVAAVEPRYFEQFYGNLALGPSGSIALFQRDGTLIARHPYIESVGASYGGHEPFRSQLHRMDTDSLESDGALGGSPRILGYRAIDDMPLVVTVGLEKETVLAEWRRRALVTSGGALGIALLGAASILLLAQRQRQRVAMQQQLAQAQKLDAVGRMAAGIVHDLRNLLGAMAGGARLVRSRATDAAALAPILDEMETALERGTTLTSKLLTVSRQQELTLEVVDVNQLLGALQPLMRSAVGAHGRFRLELAPTVWPCRLDRTQFDGALLNLIINARDAMPDGGEVRVATANEARRAGIGRAALPHGDCVRITVADNGEGMSPEIAHRVLEPFFTTKGEAGTGLGLSQVYGFVRQVGGDLRIASEPGVGTTVDLLFPRTQAQAGCGPAG